MAKFTQDDVEAMAAKGRAPSYDAGGNVRGFRSRPGAPLSKRDTLGGLGVAGDANSPDRQNAWDAWFGKQAKPSGVMAPAAPAEPVDPPTEGYMGLDLSALTPEPAPINPQAMLTAGINGNTSWLARNGLAPQQPSTIPTIGAMPSAPSPTRNFMSRYGTASVSFQPPRVSTSNPWGKPIPSNG